MNMRKLIGALCVAVVLSGSTELMATPLNFNGSFETGTLDGWTVAIDLIVYGQNGEELHVSDPPVPIFDELPFLKPSVQENNYFEAVDGSRYLEIPGNFGVRHVDTYQTNGIGTISVSQQMSLRAGSIVSGWTALYTEDYPPYNSDRAFVTVSSASVNDQPIEISVKDAYGAAWDTGGTGPESSPWTYWAWTAPSTGLYTVSLNNYMDDQEQSVAAFDGVQVYRTVPEAPTGVLVGAALSLLFGFRKRFRTGSPA
jgi:hypothetical protein